MSELSGPAPGPAARGKREFRPGLLGGLLTALGERSTYDAASQCSRCGYCEQACPTYVLTGKEAFSGRGRNQIVRMLLEDRFQDPAQAGQSLDTCLLCGACTAACYAHVPTADLVLEGRRLLRRGRTPWPVRLLGRLLTERPAVFERLLKLAYRAKRLGLARLLSRTGMWGWAGLKELELAQGQVEEVPRSFLCELLRSDPGLADPRRARWAYFAACGPNFLLPEVGRSTVGLLKARCGPGMFLDNPCCGLPFFNYGDLELARALAKRNIENFESRVAGSGMDLGEAGRPPILVGDCSSCVAHLKSYPQLFIEDPVWRTRAGRFSRAVRDVIELREIAEGGGRLAEAEGGPIAYHDSCRARHGQALVDPPRRWLRALVGERFVELSEPGWCCGGAGAFAFTQPELSDAILRRKAAQLASVQARRVATSSTSCLLQLAHGLKKYYPECRVVHLSQLAAEASQGDPPAASRLP